MLVVNSLESTRTEPQACDLRQQWAAIGNNRRQCVTKGGKIVILPCWDGLFTSCLTDMCLSTTMTVGWPFIRSAFILEIWK